MTTGTKPCTGPSRARGSDTDANKIVRRGRFELGMGRVLVILGETGVVVSASRAESESVSASASACVIQRRSGVANKIDLVLKRREAFGPFRRAIGKSQYT
jgi:hypothetical protein